MIQFAKYKWDHLFLYASGYSLLPGAPGSWLSVPHLYPVAFVLLCTREGGGVYHPLLSIGDSRQYYLPEYTPLLENLKPRSLWDKYHHLPRRTNSPRFSVRRDPIVHGSQRRCRV